MPRLCHPVATNWRNFWWLVAGLALCLFFAAPSSADAQNQSASALVVELTEITPLAPNLDTQIRITGQLTNTGQSQAQGIEMSVRTGAKLAGRSQIKQAFEPNESTTRQLVTPVIKMHPQTLGPGQSALFTATLNPATLGLTAPGVYPISVAFNSGAEISGVVNTAIPFYPLKQTNLSLVTLWPLTGPPSFTSPDTAFSDELPNQLSSGGRLSSILYAVSPKFSILADPAILEFAEASQNQYFVTSKKESEPAAGSTPIKNWWTQFVAVRGTNEVWSLPYANPPAWPPQGLVVKGLINAAYQLGQKSAALSNSSGLISIVSEKFDGNSLATMAKFSDVIVIPSDLAPLASSINYTPEALTTPTALGISNRDAKLLVADSQLTSLFRPISMSPTNTSSANALMVRQQLASDLTLIALERPSQSTLVVAVPPQNWSPTNQTARSAADALAAGPWSKPATLLEALTSSETALSRTNSSPVDLPPKSRLRPNQLEAIKNSQLQLLKIESVLQSPSSTISALQQALMRGISRSWVIKPELGLDFAEALNSQTSAANQSLAVVASPELTLTGRLGALPITINNGLDASAQVQLRATSTPGMNIDLTSANNLVVPEFGSVNLDVPIEVSGTLRAPIELYLVNSDGERVGASAPVTIRTTAYSQVAQWVSIISLVLLVIFAAMSLSRKVRKNSRNKPGRT